MSNSSVFQLITNDGKQDKILLSTGFLSRRLQKISMEAKNYNKYNKNKRGFKPISTTPSISDVQKTHVFHMVAHFKPFVSIGFEYQKVQQISGNKRLGGSVRFEIPQFGDFFADMVFHIQFTNFRAVDPGDKVKLCDYPGHRLMERVSFEVKNNILDEYDYSTYSFYYQNNVQLNKRVGWDRAVGQEVPSIGYMTSDPLNQEFREYKRIGSGYQTLKYEHPIIDLWIPLIFWFNRDIRMAIPSITIPYGQRFITINLAESKNIFSGVSYSGTGEYVEPRISTCELYINNIFVNPEIQDIFIYKIGFQLIRVHRIQTKLVNTSNESIKLHNLKWPIESMYFCLQPVNNVIGNQRSKYWYKCGLPTETKYNTPAVDGAGLQLVSQTIFDTFEPTIDKLSLIVHGIPIFSEMNPSFFNNYVPWNFGKNLLTPDDEHMYVTHFALTPGKYQPSGYYNISRSREFYIQYWSNNINVGNPGYFRIVAVALNFLIIADGTAVLRYAT